MNAPLDEKTWASVQAKAAILGIALQRFTEECGRTVYVATRVDWCVTRQIDTVDALMAFLARAEVVSGRRAA